MIAFDFRYLAVHIPFISYVRKTLGILNQGPNPPPVLRLSDGGHVENLGILPLLKLRLKKIISVYGGRVATDQEFCGTLLNALEMARKKLRCSFTALNGRDISEDIRVNLVERSPGNQPRSYRFVIMLRACESCYPPQPQIKAIDLLCRFYLNGHTVITVSKYFSSF